MDKPVQIDVEKVFREKNPRAARLIPRLLMNWISKTIRQEEINDFLRRSHGIRDVEFAEKVISDFGVKRGSTGLWNLPETGGAIVAANHPLGGLDGLALLCEAAKVRSDVRFIVNDLLMNLPAFDQVFVPVNKHGSKAREQLTKVENAYAGGNLVLVFPAGLCSRKQNGEIKDLDWSKGFISRALKYGLPVIPAYISGRNSSRFYNTANIRKFLGIKANVEMFFLPDEMFRQKGKEILIRFGKPIPASTFDHRYSQQEWAALLREYVYFMNQNQNEQEFSEFVEHHAHPFRRRDQ